MQNEAIDELVKALTAVGTPEPELTDDDKIRAAYAMNMCMVSVSQIIDYDDQYILEQEYEGILNNLNLEMMPKDEALLLIIKRLLDTITFFRIEEGDKALIDKEYQQKMKNAIWSAVPNFGLLVAGGNPLTMAVSLASQIGIGYMNYRRAKSENDLEYGRQIWQLQRSAMEQFNGLRRELFDTAWRLADTYQFPDEYRLTERQIDQYNAILMDGDEIRKYERLTTIKDRFIAYPPFWYYYGSTANHIARNAALPLSDDAREQYKREALAHFEQYWRRNKYALLREDKLASSCALEHIDLLDAARDRDRISELLKKAVAFSGYSNDILQLCAMAYMKIGDGDNAAELLRILVNEEYNLTVNAQMLSCLYVNKALNDSADAFTRRQYETLATRVNPNYLYQLPPSGECCNAGEIEADFLERQREILKQEFAAVIDCCMDEHIINLGKLIPAPEPDKEYSDMYFSDEGQKKRKADFEALFRDSQMKKKRGEYIERFSQIDYLTLYFEELNRFSALYPS